MKGAVAEKMPVGAAVFMRRISRMTVGGLGPTSNLHISNILTAKDELGLSDDQVNKLRDIQMDLTRSLIKISADLKIARLDYLRSMNTKPFNFEQIRANAKRLTDLRLQRKFAVIDAFEKAANVLNDDQKNRMADIIGGMIDESEQEAPRVVE